MFIVAGLVLLALCGFIYHELRQNKASKAGSSSISQPTGKVVAISKELAPSLELYLKPMVGVLPRKQS